MSRLVHINFVCPACQDKTKLEFIKPTLFKRTHKVFECVMCDAMMAVHIHRKRMSELKETDTGLYGIVVQMLSVPGAKIKEGAVKEVSV